MYKYYSLNIVVAARIKFYIFMCTVRPVIQFEAPEFVAPPASVHLWCSVERANPNFSMTVKESYLQETLQPAWSMEGYGLYSHHVNKTIHISEPQGNYAEFECIVTWQKAHNVSETIAERRRVEFYCK